MSADGEAVKISASPRPRKTIMSMWPMGDAEHVGDGAAKAEVHARGEQHQVVRPRRDRGREGEAQKGEEDIDTSCAQ